MKRMRKEMAARRERLLQDYPRLTTVDVSVNGRYKVSIRMRLYGEWMTVQGRTHSTGTLAVSQAFRAARRMIAGMRTGDRYLTTRRYIKIEKEMMEVRRLRRRRRRRNMPAPPLLMR